MKALVHSLLAVAMTVTLVSAAAAETVVLRGATVHPVSGPPIADATVLVDNGIIAAVGRDLDAPADATVVDLTGLHLYPGFIHADSRLGITEVSSVRGTRDTDETGNNNADLRVEVAWNADSLLLPPAAWGGVLSAHTVPGGGAFAGTSAVMRLDGWNWEDSTVAGQVGMHVNYPAAAEGDDDDSDASEARAKSLKVLNEVLDNARAYQKARTAGSAEFNSKLEGMLPVLDGTTPLFLHAEKKAQIESALEWAAEQAVDNIVLVTGADVQYVVERLKEEDVAVILDGVLEVPNRRWEPYDTKYTTPKILHEAGIRFCINGESGNFNAAHARNLPFHAGTAAAYGLPKDVALRSVTLSTAEILGVADQLGSIEPGKEATFFAATGDPLEVMTKIERVWIQGRELDRNDDHQWRLYQKYSNRPAPAGK